MGRAEEIYLFVRRQSSLSELRAALSAGQGYGVEAADVEAQLGIARNNASAMLNALVKDGRLVKFSGRPVRFFPRDMLTPLTLTIMDEGEILLEDLQRVCAQPALQADPFQRLIGCEGSLKQAVEQAKAAMLYPPAGLHTLLLGQSGVGKTLFAELMYQYAQQKKGSSGEKFPFVSFNCADYSSNPQLLLSQLFGHRKGAFTGADYDREGLVEKADGGVMLFDEVHRLPPAGQEMLFGLMDKSVFARLGETELTRRSNVQIIAATTENPESALLRTFLRRIPITITLPNLKERGIRERLGLIEELFTQEAVRISRHLHITSQVLRVLCSYPCKGNIGQLKSDIKQICAKAFLQQIDRSGALQIGIELLPVYINSSMIYTGLMSDEDQRAIHHLEDDLIITSSRVTGSYSVSKDTIYGDLIQINRDMKQAGNTEQEITQALNKRVDRYVARMLNKMGNHQDWSDIYQFVDHSVADFTIQMLEAAEEELGRKLEEKTPWILTFHLNSLLARTQRGENLSETEFLDIKEKYPKEYQVAGLIVTAFESTFGIEASDAEQNVLALLLANEIVEQTPKQNIIIIVMAHGDSTASSIAAICNLIMKTDLVIGIDKPFGLDIEQVYGEMLHTVRASSETRGVLLFADMGSLVTLGGRMEEETGVPTCTIEEISTPYILEALRRVIYNRGSVKEIAASVQEVMYPADTGHAAKKTKLLITTCSTGIGTSLMLERVVKEIIRSNAITDLQIQSIGYWDVVNNTAVFHKLRERYELVAFVGNMNPNLDIPFFDLETIVREQSREPFVQFLRSLYPQKTPERSPDIYEELEQVLLETTLILNPRKFLAQIKDFFEQLPFLPWIQTDENAKFKVSLHMAYMVERLVSHQYIIYDNKEQRFGPHAAFLQQIKHSLAELERLYQVDVTEDELCFLCEVFWNMGEQERIEQ